MDSGDSDDAVEQPTQVGSSQEAERTLQSLRDFVSRGLSLLSLS